MRVIVAGAGLSGLALATGLARDGHEVEVVEADEEPDTRRQGYRLHLDRRGLDPLQQLLPPADAALVEATAGAFAEPRAVSVVSTRLRPVRTVATGPGVVDGRTVSTAVDRGTLRAVLAGAASRCGVVVHWGQRVTAYDHADSGVLVRATDLVLEGDLLVGADGVRSRVAAQLMGHPSAEDSGDRLLVARSPVAATSEPLLDRLSRGFVAVRGLRGGLALGLMRFRTGPAEAGAAAGVALPRVDDYVMWSVVLPRRLAAGATSMGPEAVLAVAVHRMRGWHPDLRALAAAGDPETAFVTPVWISPYPEPWPAWPRGPVTLIGDAIHAMSPSRGSGANLALADAARLATAIGEVAAWTGLPTDSRWTPIRRAESEMIGAAFSAAP